jgi:hypothetical protein
MTTTKGTIEIKALKEAQLAAQRLTTYERELRERFQSLDKQRQQVIGALPPKAEVIRTSDRLVDEASTAWANEHRMMLAMSIGGRDGTGYPTLPYLLFGQTFTLDKLVGIVPGAVKAQFRAAIEGVPDEHFGLSEVERAAKLAELDEAITDVERQHTELVDHAGAVGIVLSFLPHIGDRRKQEQLDLEREERRAAERARQAKQP